MGSERTSNKKSTKTRKVREDKKTLTQKQVNQIEALSGVGLSVKKIADYLGMGKATLERRMKEDPEIYEAIKRGRARSEAKVSNMAFKMASSGKDGAMTRYWLNCRAGWQPSQKVDLSGQVTQLTPEQAFLAKLGEMGPDQIADMLAKKTPKED